MRVTLAGRVQRGTFAALWWRVGRVPCSRMLVGPCRGLPKKGQEFLRPHVVWSVAS